MNKNVALIAGVSGAVGSALARELGSRSDWKVVGLSRRQPQNAADSVRCIQVDMNDAGACRQRLGDLKDISHIFYCARATHNEQMLEDAQGNLQLLRNTVEAVEASADQLRHVHLVQGGKYYGVHVGPFPSPAQEEDSRAPIENFNYEQQDYLMRHSANAAWSWSASRPNTLIHFSPNIARNLVSSVGAYAALCREMGAALDFPGPQGAYDSLTQVTSLELLARGIAWVSTNPACANQGFNITNTDVFRWSSLWPKIAQAFDMQAGAVRPLRLTEVMAGREGLWAELCESGGLRPTPLGNVANWGYADATLERYWDEILCHNKTRESGFHEWDNSQRAFLRVLQQYRDARILPA